MIALFFRKRKKVLISFWFFKRDFSFTKIPKAKLWVRGRTPQENSYSLLAAEEVKVSLGDPIGA